ncbi:MAG: CHASE3 domain-containing protein [Bacteroidetes bacterium]|nr:CHASE3 domain-containing protein [Bacteroidota bacterium]
MKWKTEVKITNAGFIITIIFLLSLGIFYYSMFQSSLDKENNAKHTYRVLQTSKELLSNLKDAETGQRGFIITGNDSFLIPFSRSMELNAALFKELKQFTSNNPHQQERCIQLEDLMKEKYVLLQKGITVKRELGTGAAVKFIKKGEGKKVMDDIRQVFAELDHEEQQLLEQREKDTDRVETLTKQIILIGIALGLLVFVFIYLKLRKQIRRQKKDEEELFIRKEWFTQTLSSLCDGVIATDTNGIITMINKAACEISGWKHEEATGKDIDVVFEISNEDSGVRMLSPTTKALRTNHVVLLSNHTILKRKDGGILFIDDSGAPIHNQDSEIIGAILIFRDITEKKMADQQILASNVRFTKIFDLSPVAICISGLDDEKFLYVNDKFCTIVGFSREQMIGKKSSDLGITSGYWREKIGAQIKTTVGPIHGVEIKLRNANEQKIDMLSSFESIEIDNQICLLSSFIDITDRKLADKKIHQLHLDLEQKNKEVMDSIHYAKNIQTAFLPEPSELQNLFPESFILYKPKDIVCGDFYWLKHTQNKIILAVADCTGHGVPGALMSMIGSQKLNDAVLNSTDVSEILRQLNVGIKTSLRQSEETYSSKDGMDIALCSMESASGVDGELRFEFAGANRPLFIIRKESTEITEIKATKKAIGGFTDSEQHFDRHCMTMQKGDTFYLFSDGYADTFGGPSDKKLMVKKFRQMLLDTQHLPMKAQGQYLDEFIEDWKNGTEQPDDILVIGVRL